MDSTLIVVVALIVQVLVVLWMVSVLRYLRESRMIHSMTLKVLLLALSKQGIDVDIEKIQYEVKSRMWAIIWIVQGYHRPSQERSQTI